MGTSASGTFHPSTHCRRMSGAHRQWQLLAGIKRRTFSTRVGEVQAVAPGSPRAARAQARPPYRGRPGRAKPGVRREQRLRIGDSIAGGIDRQRALLGLHELGDRGALEAQRRSVGPCPQCDLADTVLHEVPAGRGEGGTPRPRQLAVRMGMAQRPACAGGLPELHSGPHSPVRQGGMRVPVVALRPCRAGCRGVCG